MFFARFEVPYLETRIFLACTTVPKINNIASRFPKRLSEAQIAETNEKAISIYTKKAMKYGLGVFQGKVLLLNIIIHLNFTRAH